MTEPQPANVQEGADQPDVLPANAEDRKAARAMSSLDANGDDQAGRPKKEVDLKALGEAMKHLDVSQPKKATEAAKKEGAPQNLVKVDPADVALLVDQLDLSKTKATELLRAHDADAVKAMTADALYIAWICITNDVFLTDKGSWVTDLKSYLSSVQKGQPDSAVIK